MGFRRLISLGGAALLAVSLSLPCWAQPSPTTVPTTNLNGDVEVGPTQNGVGGNFWVQGTEGLQAATSLNWLIRAPAASLGQNTTLTTPDPGASTANYLLDQGVVSAVTIQHVAVPLTAAQLIAMYGAPVQLIAAGATGTNIVVHHAMFTITTTSTAFTGGGVVEFQIGNTVHGGGTATTATVAASVVTAAAGTSYTTVIPVSYTGTSATGLFISNQTAAFAAGTGTAIVDIWYSIK
jgi:hypothetical protein